MTSYEEQRQKQIAKNKALFHELKLQHAGDALQGSRSKSRSEKPAAKRRKIQSSRALPQRTSARLAGAEIKPVYIDEKILYSEERTISSRPKIKKQTRVALPTPPADNPRRSADDIERLKEQWSSWKPSADLPTRDDDAAFHFASDPDFLPNLSPGEMIGQGSFGGTYWRPLYSKTLGTSVQDDWKELPKEWTEGLDIGRYLISTTYDPEINKYKVASGQSIEEWEAAGWINHEYDIRGWFQWYCRYFLGRRCDDDERQISRWKKCVGETGRWKRILLKKYQAAGIRSVAEGGDDDTEGVSPVIHQTCHHWAYEIRQSVLDAWWNG